MRTEAWLKSLGATIVLKDQASVKVVSCLILTACHFSSLQPFSMRGK